eukprot:1060599-Pleurochrysis_carterae.AAC.2
MPPNVRHVTPVPYSLICALARMVGGCHDRMRCAWRRHRAQCAKGRVAVRATCNGRATGCAMSWIVSWVAVPSLVALRAEGYHKINPSLAEVSSGITPG